MTQPKPVKYGEVTVKLDSVALPVLITVILKLTVGVWLVEEGSSTVPEMGGLFRSCEEVTDKLQKTEAGLM
jgi:hypothetical protein